jgi:hypothetical protein
MKFLITIALGLLTLLCLNSCSGTRRLAEDEVLYTGTRRVKMKRLEYKGERWKSNQWADKKLEAWLAAYIAPNGALFGMPHFRFLSVRLFFFNLFYTQKEKGFSHWMMNNFGEPPITIASVNSELRVKKMESDLFNRGHFGVKGSYEVIYKNKKKKKARIRYELVIPKAYTYRNFELVLDSTQLHLRPLFNTYLTSSLLHSGEDFRTADIDEEKRRLWRHLQNQGYFHFKQDYLLILADTTVGDKQVDLQYRVATDVPSRELQPVTIIQKIVRIDSLPGGRRPPEKLFRDKVLNKVVVVDEGQKYSLDNTRRSMRNLASLGMFAEQSLRYEFDEGDSSLATLALDLQPAYEVGVSLNGDLALKNTGFFGPALGVSLNHKNLMGGAENLTLSANGYLDFPIGIFKERVSVSSGYSINATLSTPALNTPFRFIRERAVALPRRSISLSFEQNNRVDYFRIANWKVGYALSWMSGPKVSHSLGILNINYSHLLSTTPEFDSLLNESDQVRLSFQNQLIFGPSYTFIYDNTLNPLKRLSQYYRGNVEFSGNILNGLYGLVGEEESGNRKLLGVQFSQYVRVSSDFRMYYKLRGRGNMLAFRNIIELGRAYGNSTVMPFIKQFYVGGANSMRPLPARAIGPGRYLELESSVINQVGDIRLEVNLEYRFPLFYQLYGAIWADAGNVWLFNEDPDRPLTQIRPGKIIEDSYLTAGLGLRLDLDFLVARVDYGAVLYMPPFVDGFKWIWQNKLPLYGPILGIGYPF